MFDFLRTKKEESKTSQSPDKDNVKTTGKPPRASIPFCFKKCRFIAEKEIKPKKDGDAFMLEERMTDYGDLPFEPTEQGDVENGAWMRDVRNGRFVLHFSERIPTFDSGDRMFDSVGKWYFMCENGGISVLNIHHGYQLGSVRVYQNIHADNDAAEALIRKITEKHEINTSEGYAGNTGLTEMVFILDRSGSMANLVSDTIGGYNSLIEKQKGEVFTVRYYDKETGYEVDEHPDRFTGQQSSTSLYWSLLNYRDSTYPRPSSWEENRFDPADFVILSEAGEKLGLYARTLKEALRTPMDELQVSISEYYPTTTLGSFSSETKFKALLREYEPVVMSYYETIKPIINDWETGLRECFAEEYTKPFTADPFLFLRDYYQRATDSIFFQYRDCFSEESDAGILSGFHPIKKERMSVELPKTIRTVYKSLIDTVLDKLVEQYASDVAEVIFSDPVTYLFALEKENK